jgi:signal transduction histidine kinase
VLLERWSTWVIVGVTGAVCRSGLFFQPLTLPPDHANGISSLYVQGMLICFVLDAALLVVFITRITDNACASAAKLADLRQRAAEEEHIIRMGLLASGAAHELGTPLATLAVILGDWKRMPEFKKNPELLGDVGNADPAQALQEHRQRHPAVGRRSARRIVGRHHHQHLPRRDGGRVALAARWCSSFSTTASRLISRGVRFHAQADDLQCAR